MPDGPRRRPRPAGRTTSSGRAPAAGGSSARKPAARKAASTRAPAAKKATPRKEATPRKKATTRKTAAPRKTSAPRKAAPRTATASSRKPAASRKAASRKPAARAGRPAPRPGRRIAAGLVVSVVMVGFLLVGVFPTRTWLAQREERQERQAELDRIRSEGAGYEERIAELDDPSVIEMIARREYGRVRPGETPYQMLPPAAPPVDLPDTWPFTGADDWLNR